MLNDSALNSHALNGAPLVGQGSLVNVEQNVGLIESGSLVSVEQDVQLYFRGTGELAAVEQNVASTQSGTLIPIEQIVTDATNDEHLNRTGWDLVLTLDGNIVERNQIKGQVRVDRNEGSTSLMDFTLIPGSGVQDATGYIGKTVTLDVRTLSGGTTRVYTGLVDIPEVDLVNKEITFRCADKREELIKSQISPVLSTIGSYSDVIFPKEDIDIVKKLEYRLSTVPKSVDFDAYSNLKITDWAAKATADYTLTDSEVFRRNPRVELTSRGRILNKVNINFQYRYERLHHWERPFSWTSPINSDFTLFLNSGYSLTRRDLVAGAVSSAGWPIKGNITYTDIHPAGWYGGIGFSTTQLTGVSTPVTDSSGAQITDASGNPVFQQRITGGTDLTTVLCEGASWTASTRWAQTVTEDYTLTINAPQSQTQYGTVAQDLTYSNTAESDISEWENYNTYNADATIGSTTGFKNADNNRTDFTNAVNVALLVAKNKILESHRDTRVSFSRTVWPEIGLHHTVELDTDRVACKGKVFGITHVFDMSTTEAYTEVELVLSKSQGSQAESSLVAPSIAADTVSLPTGTITLGNHFGQDPSTTSGSEVWTGMIGNAFVPGQLAKTNFTERFVVDTPDVPDAVRNEKTRSASASYSIEIPDDDLTITF